MKLAIVGAVLVSALAAQQPAHKTVAQVKAEAGQNQKLRKLLAGQKAAAARLQEFWDAWARECKADGLVLTPAADGDFACTQPAPPAPAPPTAEKPAEPKK